MKKYWFIITLCILMLGAGALTYPSLPSKIPIHFDIHGQIDGYCDKIYIFAIPLMTAILSALIRTKRIMRNFKNRTMHLSMFLLCLYP